MTKRFLASLAWFGVAWFGYEILWSITGVPRPVGPVFASAIAAFVAVDPMTLFWPRTSEVVRTKSEPSAAGI